MTLAINLADSLIVAFAIGAAFGCVLEQAGLGDAKKLAGQFYLRDFTVLKVMLLLSSSIHRIADQHCLDLVGVEFDQPLTAAVGDKSPFLILLRTVRSDSPYPSQTSRIVMYLGTQSLQRVWRLVP